MPSAVSRSAGCILTLRPSSSISTVIGSGSGPSDAIRSRDHAARADCPVARSSSRRCDSVVQRVRSVARSREASSTSPSTPRSSIRIRSDGSSSTAATVSGSIRSRACRASRVAIASANPPTPKRVGAASSATTDAAISFIGCSRMRRALGSPFTIASTFSSSLPGTSHSTRSGSTAGSASIGTSSVMPS